MGSILLRIGIIAAIAGGFWLFRDQLTGNAGDLAVGDCFDVPEAQGDIKDVQHHPCSELHSGEVIFVGDLTGQTTYPSEDVIEDFVFNTCVPAYQAYSGVDLMTAEDADLGWFWADEEGWNDGNHSVICYGTNKAVTKTQGSIKKAA